MLKYIAGRFIQAIPLLFIISVILFAIMNSIGDPLAIQLSQGRPPTGEERLRMRRRMGLDKPIYLQYIFWMIGNDWTFIDADGDGDTDENVHGPRKGILRGDLGRSLITKQFAQDRIMERLPNTLILMIPMYIMAVLMAMVLGAVSALKQYSTVDNLLTTVAFCILLDADLPHLARHDLHLCCGSAQPGFAAPPDCRDVRSGRATDSG